LAILERQGAVMATRDWESMKAPVLIVTVTLALAILLAGWLLIATGTRGENAPAVVVPANAGTHTARSLVLWR
jgi:hypothetical protein